MTKVSLDIQQDNKARNVFLALFLIACVTLYFLWDSYSGIKKELVKSTENALLRYKAQTDSIALIENAVVFLKEENLLLKQKNEKLVSDIKKQDLKDVHVIQAIENLNPSDQVKLFAEKTNSDVRQKDDIALVPIEGIKVANILIAEGEQAKNKVYNLTRLISVKDEMVSNLTQSDSLKSIQVNILKAEFGNAIQSMASQDVIINRQDKKIKNQKIAKIIAAIMTVIAIVK